MANNVAFAGAVLSLSCEPAKWMLAYSAVSYGLFNRWLWASQSGSERRCKLYGVCIEREDCTVSHTSGKRRNDCGCRANQLMCIRQDQVLYVQRCEVIRRFLWIALRDNDSAPIRLVQISYRLITKMRRDDAWSYVLSTKERWSQRMKCPCYAILALYWRCIVAFIWDQVVQWQSNFCAQLAIEASLHLELWIDWQLYVNQSYCNVEYQVGNLNERGLQSSLCLSLRL